MSTAEILEQVRAAAAVMRDEHDGRLSNIVFMGMGEPLANYNRVLGAVKRIIAPPPLGFGISARSVTVSTVGLAPAIRKLADERLGVTLALSLHAPDDELRDTLVPVNNRWNVGEALDAARYYADVTGRRVSIEYALIRDVNDQPWRGDLLGKKLHAALGPLVHVNVIPLNPTPGSKWDASPKPAEREFVKKVRERGVSCTVRDTRGREIAAACGQLAAEG
jgi:23S rRNA (adenine2503-C2)-methyltransferase